MFQDAVCFNPRVVFLLVCFGLIGCTQEPTLTDGESHLDTARIALEAGDTAAAMEALNASIESEPSKWGYFHRAQLYEQTGDDAAAISDCEAGISLQDDGQPDWAPAEERQASQEDINLNWLLGELKKTKARRFKGKNAAPPTASK